jgi:uncharacterized membrane protein
MNLSSKAKTLLIILAAGAAAMLIQTMNHAYALPINPLYLSLAVLAAPVLMLLLHATWMLGMKRAAVFLLLAATVGLLAEIWGLSGGTLFGGLYIYNGHTLKLWSVPYIIPIYWAVFIYTAYSITNSFWVWLNRPRPTKLHANLTSLIPLIALDGLLLVVLDLILDPIKVHEGAWTWLDIGPYYGIPLGNFMGWFFVTVVVTGAFRLYEYFRPRPTSDDAFLILMPTIGYGAMSLSMALTAVVYGMYGLAALSLALMFGLSFLNIVCFIKWHRPTDG